MPDNGTKLKQPTIECPDCGNPMVLRTARKGRYAGKQFYGCSTYPKCKTIVDVNGDDNGIPLEQEQSKFLSIEFPSIRSRPPLQMPVKVECIPNKPGTQSALFETISVSNNLPRILKRSTLGSGYQHALAQWRLDFPYPVVLPADLPYRSVISVAEKILKRGSTTLCSPLLQKFIDKELKDTIDFEDSQWIELLTSIIIRDRSRFTQQNFDSDAERDFYQNLLPSLAPERDIHAWVFPQISAASLAPEGINPASKQRVDFLISHPSGIRCVVEVDGMQHQASEQADQDRDQSLRNNGFDVIRIPVKEINTGSGTNIEALRELLTEMPITGKPNTKSTLDESLGLVKAASQVQIAVFEAVKGGHLPIKVNESIWTLIIDKPEWINNQNKWKTAVDAATRDITRLLHELYFLHWGIDLNFRLNIIYSTDKPQNTGVVISFNSKISWAEFEIPVFEISDIFLPFQITQSLQGAESVQISEPNQGSVEYLLDYIFQRKSFLEGQWEAIRRTLKGQDSILLLPTGGGKSLAFQLASLLLPGPCLVIDPLIALIEDQLDNLQASGIDRAVGITSQLSRDEKRVALDAFSAGNYIFAYVAPERLQMTDFRRALRGLTTSASISVIAIDEAHCVSEWGHDFRTSYLNIARNVRNYCEKDGIVPPLLGLTGTASRSVLRDVRRELGISDFNAIITPQSFDRPELRFQVLSCKSSEKDARLHGILSSLPNRFGIPSNVFYANRGEDTAAGLIFYPHVNGQFGVRDGYTMVRGKISNSVALYSGKAPKGIPAETWGKYKSAFADQFKNNEVAILACTTAFGMGIDKPNIRYTVHMNIPRSIEGFYQEAGRAGRDREMAQCCLVVSIDNQGRARKLLDPSTSLTEISQIVKSSSWEENDDITRAMYFHTQSFKGAHEEIKEIKRLVNEIDDLEEVRTVAITYKDDNDRSIREKAVHRLVIIGVIEDYSMNYANNEIVIRLSGNGKEDIISSYIGYLMSYDRKIAENTERRIRAYVGDPFNDFVIKVVEDLTLNFIYKIVEMGRRRSLSEMMDACITDPSDEGVRRRILNYLEMGRFSESLDKAREEPEKLLENIENLIDGIDSPNTAAELRGQTARMLEAYPNSPAFLLIRSVAESMCRDSSVDIVIENFEAFVKYALAEDVWNLPIEQVVEISSVFTNQTGSSIDVNLAQKLVVSLMKIVDYDRSTLRLILSHIEGEYSLPTALHLTRELKLSVETLLI